jgi:hypothetical protein
VDARPIDAGGRVSSPDLRPGAKFGIALAALACAAGVAIPAAAGAEGTPLGIEEAAAGFSVKGTHGYSVIVYTAPDSNDLQQSEAVVYVIHQGAAALYIAPAKLTIGEVEGLPTVTSARIGLGAVGQISVDFKPSGGKKVVRPSCTATPRVYAAGSYEGTIELHGEENFTDLSATQVASRPEAFINLLCAGVDDTEILNPRQPGARLEVDAFGRHAVGGNSGIQSVQLQVNENRPGGRTRLHVDIEERRGPVDIFRAMTKATSANVFAFDPHVRRARLSAGSPFSGRAIFRRDAKPANRWTGNLTIDLPGRSNVHLTGPGLHATLVHARRRTAHPDGFERLSRVFRRAIGD